MDEITQGIQVSKKKENGDMAKSVDATDLIVLSLSMLVGVLLLMLKHQRDRGLGIPVLLLLLNKPMLGALQWILLIFITSA